MVGLVPPPQSALIQARNPSWIVSRAASYSIARAGEPCFCTEKLTHPLGQDNGMPRVGQPPDGPHTSLRGSQVVVRQYANAHAELHSSASAAPAPASRAPFTDASPRGSDADTLRASDRTGAL